MRTDIAALAGLRLLLVDCHSEVIQAQSTCASTGLCQGILETRAGAERCHRFAHGIVHALRQERCSTHTCHAGLTCIRSPIRLAGETIGYLVVGSYFINSHSRVSLDQPGESPSSQSSDGAPRQISEAKQMALVRWLQLAVDSLVQHLEDRENGPDKPLPAFVTKVCSEIQRRYQEPLSLGQAAAICGLSRGYFCRAFHDFTGLRFVEYVHAVRVERVCQILRDSDCSISEAAFAVGFQSLSQFNRAFRKLKGTTPRSWRKTSALAS